jgi:hypothetical protein
MFIIYYFTYFNSYLYINSQNIFEDNIQQPNLVAVLENWKVEISANKSLINNQLLLFDL